MKPKLFIVTGSEMKYLELSTKLNKFFDCEQKPWNENEIQGKPEEILEHKIKRAYELFQQPVLVDDVSVYIDELGGFPGPYMKDFFDCLTPFEMGNKFAGSRIKAVCRLGLCRAENDIVIAKGEFNGIIVPPKKEYSQNKFFDIFVKLDGTDKPLVEFTTEEKNEFSHRGIAMKKLLEILENENK
jgi:inosine triphosphate pyrophosphatase